MNSLNRLVINLIYLNTASLLLPDKLKPIFIFLLFCTVIFRYYKIKKKPILSTKRYIISILFFIILILSYFYSEDTYNAYKKLESSFALFVFPTIFYIIAGDKTILNNFK